jgi:hypothetical protein
MKVLREVSRRSNCVDIVRKGCTVVSRRKERARRFYEVGCPKVKLEQEGEGSCGKVCEEGLPKVKLEQEGEGSAKKVAEGAEASRKYMARVGLKLEVARARDGAGIP